MTEMNIERQPVIQQRNLTIDPQCCTVRLDGEEISLYKAFAQNVFERLFTMEDSRNREIQGNGLGLTIAQNLTHQLGGDIILDSEPNVKTTFTVKLGRFAY